MTSIGQPTKQEQGLGRAFADALGNKDFGSVRALLDDRVDFRGLTPGRAWEAADPDELIETVFRRWFGDSDHLEKILSIETDAFSDRQRVAYRFRGHNPDGPFVVEQQAYFQESEGRITWMRILCSGFRPT